jgi:hypothetical protein
MWLRLRAGARSGLGNRATLLDFWARGLNLTIWNYLTYVNRA